MSQARGEYPGGRENKTKHCSIFISAMDPNGEFWFRQCPGGNQIDDSDQETALKIASMAF